MIELRQYQKDAIETVKQNFIHKDRQYIEMPTGSGKTVTFLSYARELNKKVLVIVPSKELLNQVFNTSLLFYEPWQISRKGNRFDDEFNFKENDPHIHICIINSLRGNYLKTLTYYKFDLIIIDEAHHSQSKSYKQMINSFIFNYPTQKILGVTATPQRMDHLHLDEILSECTYRLSIEDLINNNYLSDIECFRVKTKIDIQYVDSHNGDFSLNKLFNKICVEQRNKLILDIIKHEMIERKTIVFCINIKHSKILNKLCNEAGISSRHIDGTMNENERRVILDGFRDGMIKVLFNCQLLTEGFDEPSIDGVVLARPTLSASLFKQMIGRGLRIFPGKKNCKIIDVVDNHNNLCGFNSIISGEKVPEKERFNGINELREHIGNETIKVSEFIIERSNIFNIDRDYDDNAVNSMIKYLNENDILYYEPISFDDASFLIWMNELKKEYNYGEN